MDSIYYIKQWMVFSKSNHDFSLVIASVDVKFSLEDDKRNNSLALAVEVPSSVGFRSSAGLSLGPDKFLSKSCSACFNVLSYFFFTAFFSSSSLSTTISCLFMFCS